MATLSPLPQTGDIIREGRAGAASAPPRIKKQVKKEPQAPRGFLCFCRLKEMTMMKETMVKK
jgi:hypothetical protein